MTFLDFETRGAATTPPGEVELKSSLTYTSMFQVRHRTMAFVELDGEWARAEVDVRLGITDRLEAFVSIPYLYTSSGFLDSTIENYHDFLDLNQDGRDRARRNQFSAVIHYGGQDVFRLKENKSGFGDIPVGLAFALLKEDASTPGLLVRGALELPTGDDEDGFGNGRFDLGVGLVAEKSLGPLTVTAGVDYAWIRRSDFMKGIDLDLKDLIGAFLGAEVRIFSFLSGLAAVDYLSKPLDDIPLSETRRDQVMLILGGAVDLGEGAVFRFDITEDLVSDASPDFSLRLGLDLRF